MPEISHLQTEIFKCWNENFKIPVLRKLSEHEEKVEE